MFTLKLLNQFLIELSLIVEVSKSKLVYVSFRYYVCQEYRNSRYKFIKYRKLWEPEGKKTSNIEPV